MLRSMYSGVSGLRGFQTALDVVGNNIANVNTIGFKGGQTVFQDLLSQTIQGAGLPAQGGGTNPAQVGLGMRLAGTTTNFAQGGLQNTGRPTDMSIQGDGFFVVRRGAEQFFTRAGAFSLDGNGRLTSPQGALIQGWTADVQGVINNNLDVGDINMPVGTLINPQVTRNVKVGGNLPANATVSLGAYTPATNSYATSKGTVISTAITIYDDNGAAKSVTFEFLRGSAAEDITATGAGSPKQVWKLMMKSDLDPTTPALEDVLSAAIPVTFDLGTGKISAIAAGPSQLVAGSNTAGTGFDLSSALLGSGATFKPLGVFAGAAPGPADILHIDLADPTQPVTQFSAINSISAIDQDGSAPGALQTFTISQDGIITGVFSNGKTQSIAQIALATFSNPAGLEKLEGSMYRPSANSGLAQVGVAGIAGRGTLAGGTLEMSNVDLAQEFTNLIVAQRGFQAATRVITASDEVLSDLVNIKR
jgi:flagellar hook protein FlgE